MVTSSAVVASSAMTSFGIGGNRDGDDHALAHAPRQPMRIIARQPLRVAHAKQIEQFDRAFRCRPPRQAEVDACDLRISARRCSSRG